MKRLLGLIIAILLIVDPAVSASAALKTIKLSSPIVIAGSFASGGTLKITYDNTGFSEPSVEWFATGLDRIPMKISGETTSTLLLTRDQIGKVITAKATLKKPGFRDTTFSLTGPKVFSALPSVERYDSQLARFLEVPIEPTCDPIRPSYYLSQPTIGWTLYLDCQKFLNTSFNSPISEKTTWFRNAVNVSNDPWGGFRLLPADAGQVRWVVRQATFSNGFQVVYAARMQDPVPFQIRTTKPTISASITKTNRIVTGVTLTASTKGWESGAALEYAWFKNYSPIPGANGPTYAVPSEDFTKTFQVLVSATKPGFTSISVLSSPFAVAKLTPLSARPAYSAIFDGYSISNSVDRINYIVSPTVSTDSLNREKSLVKRAVDFWAAEYTPDEPTIVYLTKADTTWAEKIVADNGWESKVPNGIRSWINSNNCGFALAFNDSSTDKQVFIQCIRNGKDSSVLDHQVGPHEYTHWVQYAIDSDLNTSATRWLIEGHANFYGLALGIAREDVSMSTINKSLANHAAMYDDYNGYAKRSMQILRILETGNYVDLEALLKKSGSVFEQYIIGTLISEWLVQNYGHSRYLQYLREALIDKPFSNSDQIVHNENAFRNAFGLDFTDLAIYVAPYFAARASQIRTAR
jgi:hypothetical protein